MARTARTLTLLLSLSCLALASEDNPWPRFRQPAEGPARAIGGYSKGCLQGGVALPLDGPGYQVMRPERRRYFGHPELVDFVRSLASKLAQQQGGPLLIGDLSQPRGGRSNGGHSSHQTGLDVDIWFWHPPRAARGPLPRRARERLPARSIVQKKEERIAPAWRQPTTRMLQLAAEDPRVARMFVHPIIKRELCRDAQGERGWLQKVRPWYGHDDHVHVRLHCPAESARCEAQSPIHEGDGCDALGFWFDAAAQRRRRDQQRKYQKNVDRGLGWPEACVPLLQ